MDSSCCDLKLYDDGTRAAALVERLPGPGGARSLPARCPTLGEITGGGYPQYAPTVPSRLDDLLVPGMGDVTNPESVFDGAKLIIRACGSANFSYTITCSKEPSHLRQTVGGVSCGHPGCPICYKSWLNRAADRVGCRVEGFRQFDRLPPKHIILSLSEDDIALLDVSISAVDLMRRLRAIFKKKALDNGCHGGAMVIHLWRTTDLVPRGMSYKKWDFVRSQGRERFKELVYFSPHAHIAGYGYLKKLEKGSSTFEYFNRGPLNTRDDIERWAYYALSHSAVLSGSHSVLYFGSLGYNRLRPVWRGRQSSVMLCPVCGAEMVIEGSNELWFYPKTIAEYEQIIPGVTIGSDPPGCDVE